MTAGDANMLRHVRENTVRALPSALRWTEVASNIYCNIEAGRAMIQAVSHQIPIAAARV
jgi:hypothetical protein